MPAPKPTPDPLTAEDCRQITKWLTKAHAALTKPKTRQRTELVMLISRFETHSYIHRVNLEMKAMIEKDPSL